MTHTTFILICFYRHISKHIKLPLLLSRRLSHHNIVNVENQPNPDIVYMQ